MEEKRRKKFIEETMLLSNLYGVSAGKPGWQRRRQNF